MSLVRNRIRCIDIVHKGAINRVWFSQPDVMDFRRSHYLESIQRSIFDPSDRNAQFAAFVLPSLALIEQMLLDERLSRSVTAKFITRAIGWIQFLFNINALLLNAIMLFASEHPDQDKLSSIEGELFFNLSPDIVFRNEQYIALRSLFLQNPSTWSIDDEEQVIVLNFVLVVDHADSQRKGFIEAIRMLHVFKNLASSWTEALATSYITHLQGCEFHFKASVKNTAHNGNIVSALKVTEFKEYCTEMLSAQNMTAFNSVASKIRAHFPKATTWLKWWVNPLHAVLLFPAFRSSLLHQNLQAFTRNPKTTNLCESHL